MEEKVNKEYYITIHLHCSTNGNHKRYKNPPSKNVLYPKSYIYIPETTFRYLNKPKELTFLLNSKGTPKLKFPTIDSTIRGSVKPNSKGGYTLSIKSIEEYITGKYLLELDGDNITLTKVDDERSNN